MAIRSADGAGGAQGAQFGVRQAEFRREQGVRVLAEPRDACSGPSATPDIFTGLPGTSTGSATPSDRGTSTSIDRPATWASAMTSGAVRHGPAAMPALPNSPAASARVRVLPQSWIAGRTSGSNWATHPAWSANRGSSSHSGCPTTSASRANWWGRPSCTTMCPSATGKVSMTTLISSSIVPRTPIDQKLVTMSVMATRASSMATSTRWPSPVRSRWRRAASRPMVANRAELMSPSAPTGLARGRWPGSARYS